MKRDNNFSNLSRMYLAKAYEKKKLFKEANNVLTVKPLVSLAGGTPIYLDTPYNQIMREVAKKYNLEIIDAGQVLDKNPNYYYDFFHFDENGHRKVAHLISKRIAKILSNK